MGVQTEYLGHIDVVPSLNEAERNYLHRFARSRRCYRPEGPYAVDPHNPHDDNSDAAVELYNTLATGQPSYWCDWEPCPEGCCISWNGLEKFYSALDWLEYLIDHFLRSNAHALASGDPQFSDFTFDHQTNGLILGEQQDNRELFAIVVTDGSVDGAVLRPGDVNPWGEWRSWSRHVPVPRWKPPWAAKERRLELAELPLREIPSLEPSISSKRGRRPKVS